MARINIEKEFLMWMGTVQANVFIHTVFIIAHKLSSVELILLKPIVKIYLTSEIHRIRLNRTNILIADVSDRLSSEYKRF